MHKIVVLSDLHLVPEGSLSFGIDTFRRAMAAVTHINTVHPDAEMVVFAGDIADHGVADTYTRFARLRALLNVPSVVTLGNHDDRNTYLAAFPGEGNPATGRLDHVVDLPTHRVVVLDSHMTGSASGEIVPAQLDWLDEVLAAADSRARSV
ncbi:MAG: metallophosphoesterase, partial [Paracoccaceae bacterium]